MLTPADRLKFAEYLERDAASNEALVEQMRHISGVPSIIDRYRAEAAACRLVAAKLRAVEDQEVR